MDMTIWLQTGDAVPAARRKPLKLVTGTFGQRLAHLRKARGFSQTELSERLGVSQRVITYYECQAERPPAALLPTLAEALDVTADELLGVRVAGGSR